MSKKKAFGGSTMTLKDFHGGSIPSDLLLPSAPGVIVRPSDRAGFDRQHSWGNHLGRPDYRSRPNSSPSMRTFEDKTPFLTHNAQIGRNFDEDERKPLGGEGPIHNSRMQMEMKQDSVSAGKSFGQGLTAVSQVTNATNSYSGRITEGANLRMNSQNVGNASAVSRAYPNAWAAKKEMVGMNETMQPAWSESAAVSKLATASALDKITSGRWQTQAPVVNRLADVEVIPYPEVDSGSHFIPSYSYTSNETRNIGQTSRTDGVSGGLVMHSPVPLDVSERPRLKILPRSKPVEVPELPALDHKQGNQRQTDFGHAENVAEVYGITNPERPGSAGTESGNKVVERPRLNLKSRSQPLQQLDMPVEGNKNTLFGGARPRELVLKERGVDDVADNQELIQSPNRVKHGTPKTPTFSAHTPGRHSEKSENPHIENRTLKSTDRKDNRVEVERAEAQQKNWRNDNWRNNNNREEKLQQQQQERPRSPETWRRREEQHPIPATFDVPGARPGKAASAVELAQAFSRSSVSDPTINDNLSGQKGVSSRTQIPFSRLMASSPRPQVNGY